MSRRKTLRNRIKRVLTLLERWLGEQLTSSAGRVVFSLGLVQRVGATEVKGSLRPIEFEEFDLDNLIGVARSLNKLIDNTDQFLLGLPANHVLLYGERGTGKSSAVRGLLTRFHHQGLRVVELRKSDLAHLGVLTSWLRSLPFRFLIFVDDLAFDDQEVGFRELKAALDGSLESAPENIRLLATSNRRYLIPQLKSDNRSAQLDDEGELHLGEALEEKLALSDRFGLALAFYGFDQPTYLEIVHHYAREYGAVVNSDLDQAALRFALDRSSRSGRTAKQFVDEYVGNQRLQQHRSVEESES